MIPMIGAFHGTLFKTLIWFWGAHSIDRFANYLNAELPRFNSRFWNPGSEGIHSFVMDCS